MTQPIAPADVVVRQRGFGFYVAYFLLLQGLAVGSMLYVSSLPWFPLHAQYSGWLQAGYSLRLRNADCDVLLYGDSSAVTALDPQIIGQMTGLRACNIAEGTTIQAVVGSDYPLQQYLAHNKRPKYLLAMYTPSIFTPTVRPFSEYHTEGILYGFQYDFNRAFVKGMAIHMKWTAQYAVWVGYMLAESARKQLLGTSKPAVDTRAQRAARNGIWPYPLPPQKQCVRHDAVVNPVTAEAPQSVAHFRETYQVQGTTVLINVAPMPDCSTMFDAYRKRLAGLHDNDFEALPIRYFNETDVHFSAEGSQYLSKKAGTQIRLLMMHDPTTPESAHDIQ